MTDVELFQNFLTLIFGTHRKIIHVDKAPVSDTVKQICIINYGNEIT